MHFDERERRTAGIMHQGKNLKEFREIYKNRNNEVYAQLNREVQTMAERYVSKLIPGHRRIYLPKVQRFEDVRIIYKEAGSKENIIDSRKIARIEKNTDVKESVGAAVENDLKEKTDSDKTVPKNQKFTISMLELIYDRTGMRFLPEAYFVREWSGDQLKFYEGLTLQDMSNMDIFHLNVAVQRMIKDMYNEVNKNYFPQSQNMIIERLDSFFQVMGWFELFRKNVADIEKETYVYRMRVLYTIRIHKMLRKKQYVELINFFNGYIWGTSFSGLLPMHTKTNIDRSRFAMRTVVGFNAILREMNLRVDVLPVPEIGKRFYVSRIAKNGARNSYIKAWIILGLFSNMYYYNNQMLVFSFQEKIISRNNQIRDFVHISLENYLVALCDFKADERYAALICQLQDKMIQRLVWEGIGIETNPSSNYLIGTIQKYEEHPIIRFNARKLKPTKPNMSLNVSINTDDQGVFDTMLENEYALMALALKKQRMTKTSHCMTWKIFMNGLII